MEEIFLIAGKNIRLLREQNKYTREQLAELAELSPQFLYEIECGKKGFSANTLYRLSNVLSVSCEYILVGSERKSTDEKIDRLLHKFTLQQKKDLLYIIETIYNMQHHAEYHK